MNYVEYDENNLQALTIEETAISDGKLIGTFEKGKAEIQLINDSNEYSNFKNKWIQTNLGSFYIYDVEPVQEKINIKLSCYDIKYKFDVAYDQSKYESIFPCTIARWRRVMSDDIGVQFGDEDNFPLSNFVLDKHPYVGDNVSYANVFQQLSEACISIINHDNEDIFYFDWINEEVIDIPDWIELTSEKESTLPINELVLGRGDVEDIVIYPEPAVENATEFRINNNYILDPQDTTEEIDRRIQVREELFNRINGFKYTIFNMRTQSAENVFDIKLGSKVKYIDIWGNEIETIVMSRKLEWLGNNLNESENYQLTISAEQINESSSEYSYASSVQEQIKDTSIKVDKQNQKIEAVVSNVNSQNEKISKVTQTVEELKAEIGSTTDVTTTAEGPSPLYVKDLIAGEPIYLKITPNSKDIKRTYVSPRTIIGRNTIIRTRRIVFETTKEIDGVEKTFKYTYELPKDLYQLGVTKDELIIDYEESKTYIIHRIGIDENGNKYVLPSEQEEELEYQSFIYEEAGDYNIYLTGYPEATLYIRAVVNNILTSQFATKVELNSSIKQVSNEIDIVVKEKVNKDEIIASINAAVRDDKGIVTLTGNSVIINSDNFTLDSKGNMTCKNAKITGNSSISGNIYNYDRTSGKLALSMVDQTINFYDWKGSGNKNGGISSTYNNSTKATGIFMYGSSSNRYVGLGYQQNDNSDNISQFIYFDQENPDKTPYIKNTVSGTLFSKLDSGGIEIEHGLIKNWDISSTYSGTFNFHSQSGTNIKIIVKSGLIQEVIYE